jgi:hypothetical protein
LLDRFGKLAIGDPVLERWPSGWGELLADLACVVVAVWEELTFSENSEEVASGGVSCGVAPAKGNACPEISSGTIASVASVEHCLTGGREGKGKKGKIV